MIEKLIKTAMNEVDYTEKNNKFFLYFKVLNHGTKNFTKYAKELDAIDGFYNSKKQGYAWCDVFVDWCFVKTFGVDNAKKLLLQPDNSYGAGCKYSAGYFMKNKQFHDKPQVGDQIFFKNLKGRICHTGIVYKVDKSFVYTIEGNAKPRKKETLKNDGRVRMKKYFLNNSRIVGYGRPDYIGILGQNKTL